MRDMVERFKTQRPMSRAEREQEFGSQGPQFWWKEGEAPQDGALAAAAGGAQPPTGSTREATSSSLIAHATAHDSAALAEEEAIAPRLEAAQAVTAAEAAGAVEAEEPAPALAP
jgi:hypothetical protein